jgi:hypothetical protein
MVSWKVGIIQFLTSPGGADSVSAVTNRASLAALASLWLLAAHPAGAAQGVGATIEGRVVDDAGAPVDGVTVTALNPATGFQRMTTTGDDGRFVLAGLPVEGVFDVRAEKPGFAATVRQGVAVRPDQVLSIDFTLRVAAQDTIGVTAASAPLERADVSLRQTVDEDLIRALPVARRGFLPLASLAAGLTGHPDFPNPHGQVFWTNNVLVDGVSHFSKWRSAARSFSSGVPLEAVRQVQVLTALYSAEFGEGLASITSVTTRAGTNEWHGSALLFGRHHALDAPPVFSARKPAANGQQYGFSLGGPLVANRTHLFTSYEGRRSREHNIVVSPVALNAQVPDDEDEHLLFARVDHQYGDRLLMARYNGERFRWHHEPGGIAVPGSGTAYGTNAHSVLLTAGLPLSPRTLHEPRFQISRYVHNRRDLQPSVFISQAGLSTAGGALGPFGFDADPEDTLEGRDALSHSWRAHTVRAGGGIKYVRARNSSLPFGRGAYFLAGAQPYLFMQGLAPAPSAAVAEPHSLSGFVFAQTDWSLRDVRMNLGLRYDIERVSHIRGYDLRADINNVQPRSSVAWDVAGRGRTVVRGGFGVYAQQHLLYPINRVQLEGVDGAILLTLTPGSPLFPRFPAALSSVPAQLPPRDIHQVAPDFRNPYALQASGGVQRAFFGGIVSADYVYLAGRDLISLIDVNAPASLAKPAQRTVEQADATRPFTPAIGGLRKVITLGNEGRSWYHALEVKFERTVGPLHVLASYTRSRAEDMGNYELPEDSRNLQAEKAPAAADVPHSIAAAFDWIVPGSTPLTRGWSVSGIGLFRSSRPYTISWGDDRAGTTQNDARPGGRNTARTGAYRTVDLAVTKRFRRDAMTIDARAQAFNALNATNYDQYVGELVSPLYGRPISAFPPRQLELAAIVRF